LVDDDYLNEMEARKGRRSKPLAEGNRRKRELSTEASGELPKKNGKGKQSDGGRAVRSNHKENLRRSHLLFCFIDSLSQNGDDDLYTMTLMGLILFPPVSENR
jgi:hypothetical protein